MSSKPIHVIADRNQIGWSESIDRTQQMIERDRLHGHKLPYRVGDQVMTPDGKIGILTHKEFLRECPEAGHDIWQLEVQFGAFRKNYTNPAALQVPKVQKKTQTWGSSQV
jgi:hypothetical protein